MKAWKAVTFASCLARVCLAEPPDAAQMNALPLLERAKVTGDWVRIRPRLSDRGVEFFATCILDAWSNATGKVKPGSPHASVNNLGAVSGDLNFGAMVDLEKAVGWRGASMSTTWVWLYGSTSNAAQLDPGGKFLGVSNIAGFNTLRLFTLWFQTGQSANTLADSTNSGNAGFYIVLDQMLYREPGNLSSASLAKDARSAADGKVTKSFKSRVVPKKSDQGLGCFLRAGFAPPDRNFLSFYFDTGLTYKGLIPGRDSDTAGVGFAYGLLSNGARSSLRSQDVNPTDSEMVVELTYQAPITQWLVVQPDPQYFINPGANSDLTNALVIEARATVIF